MKNNLIPGKKTPSLKVDTLKGASWSIDDHLDKTKNMIIFYIGLHCSVCSDFLKQIDIQLFENKKSNPRGLSDASDAHIETNTIGAS